MSDIPVWKLFVQTYTKELVIAAVVFAVLIGFQVYMMIRYHRAGMVALKKRQAVRDGLTGFCRPNEFVRLVRNHMVTVSDLSADALVIFDIDDMHSFNKENGFSAGDRKITELVEFITSCFRSSDIFCRLEGDMFAVYLKNIHSREILERKCSCFTANNSCLPVSIGATMVGGREDYPAVYERAIKALEASKKAGKAGCTIL